ncbi:hypothetical protein ACTXT7_006740 [Hymenolepis weldensis]
MGIAMAFLQCECEYAESFLPPGLGSWITSESLAGFLWLRGVEVAPTSLEDGPSSVEMSGFSKVEVLADPIPLSGSIDSLSIDKPFPVSNALVAKTS